MRIFFVTCLLITTAVISSCKNDKPDSGSENNAVDSEKVIKYVDSLYVLDDTFSAIKRMLCSHTDDNLTDYTNENSSYIIYDFLDPTSLFFYISNVDCGIPGGTCGDYISLIERKDNNSYIQKIQTCGHIDSVVFSRKELYFSTVTDKKQYLLKFSEVNPTVEFLSVNHIPVYEIEFISNSIEVMSDNLMFDNEKTENPDAIQVKFHEVDINSEFSLIVYSLKNNNIPYSFAFLRKENKSVKDANIGGTGHITWNINQNQVMVKYQSGQTIEQYKTDLKKKSFVKI